MNDSLPTRPGWYTYPRTRNTLIFLLNGNLDWYAVTASGEMDKCDPAYIAQGGRLKLMAVLG